MPPALGRFADAGLPELVAGAQAGDQDAWRELCGRVRNVAWKTINGFGVRGADAEDAYAATMFRLAEHLDRIRDPERLPGWVATTARHETLGLFRTRKRALVVDEVPEPRDQEHLAEADQVEHDELRAAVRQSFALLDERCRKLLRLLTTDPPLAYDDVGELMDMPRGSIGPTRRRCLETLRSKAPLRAYLTEAT